MTQDKDQMRAEFEAAYAQIDPRTPQDPFQKIAAWATWQAAKASAPQGVPEGFALVPIEPTKEMLDEAATHLKFDIDDKYLAKGIAICVYKDMVEAASEP